MWSAFFFAFKFIKDMMDYVQNKTILWFCFIDWNLNEILVISCTKKAVHILEIARLENCFMSNIETIFSND